MVLFFLILDDGLLLVVVLVDCGSRLDVVVVLILGRHPPSRAVWVERLFRASRDREVSGEVIFMVCGLTS